MEKNYWEKKWEANDILFHQSEVNPYLKKYEKVLTCGTVLVPLCGKTGDMVWLVQRNYKVVGCELSEIACRDFFSENQITHSVEREGNHQVFRSDLIDLWCGDFFEIPASAIHGVTSIFDRAALVALPTSMRRRYAEQIARLSDHMVSSNTLLITFEYDQTRVEGPPHSVLEEEVNDLFGSTFTVKLLERVAVPPTQIARSKFASLPALAESVYQLS